MIKYLSRKFRVLYIFVFQTRVLNKGGNVQLYTNQLVETTKGVKKNIDEMISAAERQNVKNVELLYSLQLGLQEALIIMNNNKRPDLKFVRKWNLTIGLASRFFDGDSFLETLHYIDNGIIPDNLKLY